MSKTCCGMTMTDKEFEIHNTPEHAARVVFNKAAMVEDAMRAEYNTLRQMGKGSLNSAGSLSNYLQDADDESKARLYDLIVHAR